METTSVRRALYALFGRLLAGELSAELYERLRTGGLDGLAQAQGVDLFSDLLDERDAESSVVELGAEYARLTHQVSLRASDYSHATDDPVVALNEFLSEHELTIDKELPLPHDHLSLVLGIMGQLAQREDDENGMAADDDAEFHAKAFFRRHVLPWAPRALAEVSAVGDRRFYRGIALMLSTFLETERARYQAE